MKTKTCPICGKEVHEDVVGCPHCGARWDEDGRFLGPAPDEPPYVAEKMPATVGEMSPDQLRSMVRNEAFWAAVLALVAMTLLGLALGAVFSACG